MIVDNTIKKAVYDNTRVSKIHKGNDLAWVEGEISFTTMATGPTLNAVFNKNMTSFALAGDDIAVPASGTTDISALGDGSVVTWFASDTQYYKPIGFDKAVLNPDSSKMFYNCTKLTSVSDLDTSNVTDMNTMFDSCSSMTTAPKMNTSNVVNMNHIFSACHKLASVPELDVSNVIDMGYMFYSCMELTDVHSLNASKVTNMENMFLGCSYLNNLDVSELDTSNVTNMYRMFINCTRLTAITYGDKFVNDLCTNFTEMYKSCPANKPEWANGTWDSNGTFTKTT